LLKEKSRLFQYFQLTQQGVVCFAFKTVSLADVVPDAHLVDYIDGFRPSLSRSIGIQSICQSGVRTAEVVSAETAIFVLATPGNPIYIVTASVHKVFQKYSPRLMESTKMAAQRFPARCRRLADAAYAVKYRR
jgi:hypothetical protein